MEANQKSHRIFICGRCKKQVRICTDCDHGQIYCPLHCAEEARAESIRKASSTYQKKPEGRDNHARRQKRYRNRPKTNNSTSVTHQGSKPCQLMARMPLVLAAAFAAAPEVAKGPVHDAPRCDFCGCPCGSFSRFEFLNSSGGYR
jgi:hypothetical protein